MTSSNHSGNMIGRYKKPAQSSFSSLSLPRWEHVQEEVTLSPLTVLPSVHRRKKLPFLLALTVGFMGLQGIFTVFFGSGSFYLRSLGFSDTLVSLSWLAGPVAGVSFQPYIGAVSDRCSCSWGKRRPFILVGTLVTICAMLATAWAQECGALLSTNPNTLGHDIQYDDGAVFLGTVIFVEGSIWIANFSIQPVQMGLRALVVDSIPVEQQSEANAWAARLTMAGNAVGYCISFTDLTKHFHYLGGTQFKVLCSLVSINLAICISITCYFVQENRVLPCGQPAEKSHRPVREGTGDILQSRNALSSSTRKVCVVQVFSWLAWFPFLFYATEYVGGLYRPSRTLSSSQGSERIRAGLLWEESNRVGSFAMAIFAVSSLIVGIVLPALAKYCSLRRIWLGSHVVFASCMFMTFFASSVKFAYIIVGAVGFSWAATTWIPFALISIELKQSRVPGNGYHAKADPAATVIGIHNIAIAAPQIFAALGSSFFFWLAEHQVEGTGTGLEVWLLRVSGLSALVAAWMTRRLPEEHNNSMW